jgi:flagellar basal-body rod protein FlgB
MMLNRLTAQIDFQAQALALRAERQRLLAGNIANADTPGYQARDLDFAAALRAATRDAATAAPRGAAADGAAGASGAGALGDPIARLGAGSGDDRTADALHAALRWAAPAQTNLDRNTVDMDRERASFADNAVRYEATLRFVSGQLRTLQDAIRSHTGV